MSTFDYATQLVIIAACTRYLFGAVCISSQHAIRSSVYRMSRTDRFIATVYPLSLFVVSPIYAYYLLHWLGLPA
ncbi:hypothetical protein D8W71_03205 [Rhodococcus sp. P1Y]|nr:hypothetical protein D8W71_03205 [Rhodococcus sp. P1Y]